MAYFKILPILRDKYVDMGMLNISAELYLEQGDEGYDKYISEHKVTVEDIEQLNPFCTHSIQFEANVTEEEILWCFEFALGITHRNYLKDDLHCQKGGQVVNRPFHYSARREFYKGVPLIPADLQSDYMKIEIAKVAKAEAKINQFKNIDFTKVKTIGKYSVRQ